MRRKSAACVFSLLCALLLTMWAPAYAAQPLVPALDEIPAVLYGEDSALSGQICLLDADEPVWGEDDTSYKDQLTGYALDIYKALGNAFSDFDGSLENGGIVLDEGREIGGARYTGWLVKGVLAADVEVDLTGVTDNAVASALVNAAYSEWVLERYAHVAVACAAFTKDHPEYFWISASYYPTNEYESIEWADDSYSTYVIKGLKMNVGFTVQPECDTIDEITALRGRLDSVIGTLLAETRELSIPAKLTYWDNWLAENNDYNQEAAADSYGYADHTPWTIVGGFLPEYQPVCEGYAKAF